MEKGGEETHRKRRYGQALVDLLKEAGPYALVGLAGAIILLLVFAKLSEEVFTNEITSLDNNSALWVHSFASQGLTSFFTVISEIGGPIGIPLMTAVGFALLVWKKQMHNAWRLVLAVVGGLALNQVLKLVFHRPRPDLWEQQSLHFAGFSFPSGHATLSFCLFGMFIWLGWRYIKGSAIRTVWTALMLVMIGLVGLSRIYLGAHYPSDVLAGYISAAFWLAALLSGSDIFDRVRSNRTRTT